MPDLWFDPEADATLTRLEQDPARQGLVLAIKQVLRLLERDSGTRFLRAIRFQDPPLWCVIVRNGDEDWAVLWGGHPTATDTVVIHYIGPGDFR